MKGICVNDYLCVSCEAKTETSQKLQNILKSNKDLNLAPVKDGQGHDGVKKKSDMK